MQCAIPDSTPVLDHIPESFDLREVGLSTVAGDQGACGSCWAFAVQAAAESNFLWDYDRYKDSVFGKAAADLSVSVQYILSSTRSSSYCDGGDAASALWERKERLTEELTSNFPYVAGKRYKPSIIERPAPRLPVQYYALPYEYQPMQRLNESTYVVRVLSNKDDMQLSEEQLRKLKQWLALGIPLVAEMYVDDLRGGHDFSMYHGQKALYSKCSGAMNNHQVVIVGYGLYKGVSAWAVKNSWGSRWGSHGHFYVEMRKNAYCIERYMYAALPAGFDQDSLRVFTDFRPSAFALRRGIDGFDRLDGGFTDLEAREALIYNTVGWACSVAVCGLLCGILWYLRRKEQPRYVSPESVRLIGDSKHGEDGEE